MVQRIAHAAQVYADKAKSKVAKANAKAKRDIVVIIEV
jgi:hypothetical protein